ncbi:MAG: porin family protein [Saprospiraceae bacterium]|nr:porin family protein [Saprospiraceae bacterium]
MRTIYALLIASCCSFTAFGQQGAFSLGTFAGLSAYGGDLVEQDIEITEMNPALGIIGRYELKSWLTLRGSLMAGTISGSDLNSGDINRRKRNLSFRSPIYELSVMPEFNIYTFNLPSKQTLTPYAFIGAGVFYYNPKALYEGEWVQLQPLGTEGQGLPGYESKYNLIDFSIPYGIGLKFAVSDKATIGLEFGTRYTFTDYLDDVSTVYPDNKILAATSGALAAALSDRTSEYTGIPTQRAENAGRGGAVYPDVYHFIGATVTINLFTPEVVEKK